MASKIIISNVISRITRDASSVTISERKAGKLQAGTITSKFKDGLKIDVLALKNKNYLIMDNTAEFNEEDIREDTRRTFVELADLYLRKGRLPVHTSFFKELKDGDIIEIILHN